MKKKTVIIISVIVVVLIIGIRIALPYIIKDYVNKTLDEIEGYRGQVEDINLRIVQGAYEIEGIVVEKTGGMVPVPFFSADVVELSVEWKDLFEGAIVGEIEVFSPKLNFVQGPSEETKQIEPGENWQEQIKDLFPLRIDRFEIIDGEIHYRDFSSDPQVDIYLSNVDVVANNLTNSEDLSESMVAKVKANGEAMNQGHFVVNLDYDPYASHPTFSLDAELENIQLVKLNNFLKAYGNFDVQRGLFGLYAEFAASDGNFKGYVKPFFKDIEVFSWKEDDRNLLETVWEAVAGAVADLLENPEKEQIATRVPIEGKFDNPEVGVWSTVGTLLKNAFIEALIPGIEKSIQIKDLSEKK